MDPLATSTKIVEKEDENRKKMMLGVFCAYAVSCACCVAEWKVGDGALVIRLTASPLCTDVNVEKCVASMRMIYNITGIWVNV